MARRKAGRHARELLTLYCSDHSAQSRVAQQPFQFVILLVKHAANGRQFFPFWRIHSTEDQKLLRGEMEIEGRTVIFGSVLQRKDCGDVCLIRSLVMGEAGVAVDPKHRLLRWSDIVGSERGEL